MEQSYYVWSTAMQGWATYSGAYTSDLKEARTFGRYEALARCILHYKKEDGVLGLLPINADDLNYVTEKSK